MNFTELGLSKIVVSSNHCVNPHLKILKVYFTSILCSFGLSLFPLEHTLVMQVACAASRTCTAAGGIGSYQGYPATLPTWQWQMTHFWILQWQKSSLPMIHGLVSGRLWKSCETCKRVTLGQCLIEWLMTAISEQIQDKGVGNSQFQVSCSFPNPSSIIKPYYQANWLPEQVFMPGTSMAGTCRNWIC